MTNAVVSISLRRTDLTPLLPEVQVPTLFLSRACGIPGDHQQPHPEAIVTFKKRWIGEMPFPTCPPTQLLTVSAR